MHCGLLPLYWVGDRRDEYLQNWACKPKLSAEVPQAGKKNMCLCGCSDLSHISLLHLKCFTMTLYHCYRNVLVVWVH